MSYRFKLDEPLQTGVRRILDEQVALAMQELRTGPDRAVAVHETRKAMKRARALLKLARPGLKDETYDLLNATFRDVGRVLSSARDGVVLAETARRIGKEAGGKTRSAAEDLARAANGGNAGMHVSGKADQLRAEAVTEAVGMLEAAERAIRSLKLVSASFGVLRKGLEKSYGRGRRAMHLAYREGDDEAFHEWRKAAQAHWRHMLLLDRAWPELFDARAKVAKQLSELLGEDHDLAILVEHAQARAAGKKKDAKRASGRIIDRARARQDELRRHAHAKGEALFAEDAGNFAERIEAYWSAAEEASRLAERDVPAGATKQRNGKAGGKAMGKRKKAARSTATARKRTSVTGRAADAAQPRPVRTLAANKRAARKSTASRTSRVRSPRPGPTPDGAPRSRR